MITNILDILYNYFDFTNLYKAGLATSESAFALWSLLVLSIGCTWRLTGEAIMLSTGEAKFPQAVRDCIIASILTVGYSTFWIIFSDLYSSIATALNVDNLIYELLDNFRNDLDRKGTFKQDKNFFDYINGSYLLGKVAWGFWYISAIMLITVDIFLRVIHALLYTMCAVSGTIIIPLAALNNKSIVWNWLRISTIVLLWPITLGVLLRILLQVMNFDSYDNSSSKVTNEGSILIFQTILNVIVICLQVSAIRITQEFVTATSDVASMTTPFSGAGIATGAILGSQMKDHILRRFNSSKGGISKKRKSGGKRKPAKLPQKKRKGE